jgi:Type ISP C-terminal specificity domain
VVAAAVAELSLRIGLHRHRGWRRDTWPLERIDAPEEKSRKAGLAPKAMLRANKYNGNIQLDSETQLAGVPPEAWAYRLGNRWALEWILDRHKKRTQKERCGRRSVERGEGSHVCLYLDGVPHVYRHIGDDRGLRTYWLCKKCCRRIYVLAFCGRGDAPLIGVTILPDKIKHTAEAESGRIMRGFRRTLTAAMRAKWLTIGLTLAALAVSIFGMRFVDRPSDRNAQQVPCGP